MLLKATLLVDLIAMAVTLWMAFYLLARGFPSTITLRMVIVSLVLSGFFFGAYNNVFIQVQGTAAVRAVLLVIGLGGWYSVTYRVMSDRNQKRFRWMEWGVYGLAIISIVLLVQPTAFTGEEGNALYVAHMNGDPPYIFYSLYQFLVAFGIMLNLLIGDRVGLTSRGKYYLVASIFPILSVIYGVASLGSEAPAPRIVQDALAFLGIFILNLAVARHQVWMERRATLQDFPLTSVAVLGLSSLYGYIAWMRGMSLRSLATVIGLTIITLGCYDLVREFLERLRIKRDMDFHKQLNRFTIENANSNVVQATLQNGLDLLCETLGAPGGFVAVRKGEKFLVVAGRRSVPVGSELPASAVVCDDVCHPRVELLSSIAWIAPAFEGQTQSAVIGLAWHPSKLDYSTGDLDLLAEVAEHMGGILSLGNRAATQAEHALHVHEQTAMHSAADAMLASISGSPDDEFIKLVEDGLRHFSDFIVLGQSPLADWIGIRAVSHVERGKQLHEYLLAAIDAFRPAGTRPPEPLPRVWYSYVVLHDAYVEGVANREIMARLYISEGTFNRTRRNAIRGLARFLVERSRVQEKAVDQA